MAVRSININQLSNISIMKKTKSESGKMGADKRWTNYRLYLIKELSALSTKEELNAYQEIKTTSILQGILLEKRSKKKSN